MGMVDALVRGRGRVEGGLDLLLHPGRHAIHRKFAPFTMVPRIRYVSNLALGQSINSLDGAIVECGVWRGGMIAGLAAALGPDRRYCLFDSFEGLPDAKEIDGPAARAWQFDIRGPDSLDNCAVDEATVARAMALAGIDSPDIHRGWFEETVPAFARSAPPIALLRLDGDWYDSTLTCLTHLFPLVVDRGKVVIDDYGSFDGCNRAAHRYLADHDRPEAIRRTMRGDVPYIEKRVTDVG